MSRSVKEDIPQVLAVATQGLSQMPDAREIQRRIFDVRRILIEKALASALAEQKHSEEEKHRYEDMLRDALPPLVAPVVRQRPHFSAWRSALVAVLGLLFGSAIGQGIASAQLSSGSSPLFSAGTAMLCGIMGVMGLLWLTEWLVRGASQGHLAFPWGRTSWKRFRRAFFAAWIMILCITIGRDFLTGQTVLVHMLQSLGLFLSTGQMLGIFTNGYGLLAFLGAIALLLKRPMYFEREDFEQSLAIAVHNWWAGAHVATQLLVENAQLKNDDMRETWQRVGRDLYSLAGELPEARGQWMQERLRRLGMEAPREQGVLTWSVDLQERYTPLGYLEQGDACFVDEPPILENGTLVRKGTVRKVRSSKVA